MPHNRYTLTADQLTQLQSILATYPAESTQHQHASALFSLHEGSSPDEVATQFNITRRTLFRWLRRWHDEGMDGLSDHTPTKRQPWSNARYEATLVEVLRNSPLHYHLLADGWTTALLCPLMETITGIAISQKRMRNTLHRLGYHFNPFSADPEVVQWYNQLSKGKGRYSEPPAHLPPRRAMTWRRHTHSWTYRDHSSGDDTE